MHKNTKRLAILVIALSSAIFGNSLYAQQRMHDNKKPPKEAIEACVDKSEGDAVTFTTRHGHKLSGICSFMEDILVAVPENHPSREENN